MEKYQVIRYGGKHLIKHIYPNGTEKFVSKNYYEYDTLQDGLHYGGFSTSYDAEFHIPKLISQFTQITL